MKAIEAQHIERQNGLYKLLYDALEKQYPGKVRIIPASAAVVEVVRRFEAGTLPDLDCLDEDQGRAGKRGVFSDGGHLSEKSGLEQLIGYLYPSVARKP